MYKRLQGMAAGLLFGAILTGSVAFAKTGSERIEAFYNNIKIFVDGVKINPKDTNGNTVEPFIYNGTTYLPVRAVGETFGKEVSWDGSSNTVYIGKTPAQTTYLVDVCPAYEYNSYLYKECTSSNGKSFQMGGKKYSNGFYAAASSATTACFNLNGEYRKMSFIAGAVDNSLSHDAEIRIFSDNKLVKSIDISNGILPKEYSVDLNYALQLKVEVHSSSGRNIGDIGMADIILE